MVEVNGTSESNFSDDTWDVSSIFWSFVHDMNHMDYDDLVQAHSYIAMSDASNSGQAILLDESLLVPVENVPDGLLDKLGGIAYDSDIRCYVFDDSNALFLGSLQLLHSTVNHPSVNPSVAGMMCNRANILDACVKRMQNTLSIFDAVGHLGALKVD